MQALEQAVRRAWVGWGDYAQWTICSACHEHRYCRSKRRGKWLCLGCFDQKG